MTNPGGVEDLRRGASCGGRVPIAIAALLLVLTGMAVSGISGTPTARACCGSTPFTHRFRDRRIPKWQRRWVQRLDVVAHNAERCLVLFSFKTGQGFHYSPTRGTR